jgi:hypothetical protein
MRNVVAFCVGIFAGCVACWLADSAVVRHSWLAPLPFVVLVGVCFGGAVLLKRR